MFTMKSILGLDCFQFFDLVILNSLISGEQTQWIKLFISLLPSGLLKGEKLISQKRSKNFPSMSEPSNGQKVYYQFS